MIIENVTHAGIAPSDGDQIKITYANGSTETKYFFAPVAPPAPPAVRHLTQFQYLMRFTRAERIAIRGAAASNPVVSDFVKLLDTMTDVVNLDDPDTVAGLNALEAAGLICTGRAVTIRA